MSAAGVRFDQHPRRANRPAEQLRCARFVENCEAGEADRFARTVALDDQRLRVADLDDAHHFGTCAHGQQQGNLHENNDEFDSHGVLAVTGRDAVRARGRRGIGGCAQISTNF
ncbi:MAG TPA: hypothetical protein VF883_25010 [Thermoanaerobaculia bacterium]